eukprot:COSAG06_NODE_9337_length_1926_cov_538.484401_1_plen_412_part_00
MDPVSPTPQRRARAWDILQRGNFGRVRLQLESGFGQRRKVETKESSKEGEELSQEPSDPIRLPKAWYRGHGVGVPSYRGSTATVPITATNVSQRYRYAERAAVLVVHTTRACCMFVGCCSGRPSHEEGVPPDEAQQGRAVREEPPVAEQPAAAPTPTAAPLKTKMCAELELLLAKVQAAGPEIDLAVAMVHVSQAQLAVAAALGAAAAELVDQTADDEPTAADDDDAPPADADAPLLPLGSDEFPDEALAVVCRFLGLRDLGRLACAARRFTEPTLTEPGGAELLSPIEEGARLRLAAAAGAGGASGGAAAVRLADETWMRALWRLQYRLLFTSCGPEVVLSEEGALRLRAAEGAAAATRCLWGRARSGTRAGLHSVRSWLPGLQRARGACCACARCFACGRRCHPSLLSV